MTDKKQIKFCWSCQSGHNLGAQWCECRHENSKVRVASPDFHCVLWRKAKKEEA